MLAGIGVPQQMTGSDGDISHNLRVGLSEEQYVFMCRSIYEKQNKRCAIRTEKYLVQRVVRREPLTILCSCFLNPSAMLA
ncbi:hypothetical protein NDU88_005149 [Pleurodeles waltl]|uniref:Uncharacterized protein n=1 Tax=Pleurodeles waltl TaxID=8319 RepID=A0AAV7MBA1_PLEWA|nr:hypothetical protein NDU88_005149 [Pleurodeles waltl]